LEPKAQSAVTSASYGIASNLRYAKVILRPRMIVPASRFPTLHLEGKVIPGRS